jgi:ubiquinone/menaquinone biosynthesis C-methylase UbiE
MQKKFFLLLLFTIVTNLIIAQKTPRPYRCGWVVYDTIKLNESHNQNLKYWNVQKGETVASIGAQNGNLEVRYALFVDSIHWTLEDIDTSCLNKNEFEKVKSYYEKLCNKKINSDFTILIGTETSTNLKDNTYDRILLINTYHELSKKAEILAQINTALKSKGKLVIMEKMAKKKGKKRKDCKHIMPFEPDFLIELQAANFKLVSKNESDSVVFYELEKIN